MERRFGAEPEPDDRATERETRSFRRIQGGDAAKAAEDSARESGSYQGAFGINLRTTRGARFELEKPSEKQVESPPVSESRAQNTLPDSSQEQESKGSESGISKRLFRKLFRP